MITTDQDERGGLPSMSSNARTLACPGWMNLAAGMAQVKLPEKQWTKDGTLGHDVLAGDADEEELEGREDLAHAVAVCRDRRIQLQEELGFGEPDEVITEQRFFLHGKGGTPVASGKPDLAIIKGRTLFIPDYKTGRKDVLPPAINPQLIGYALLIAEEYEVDEAILAIIPAWRKVPAPAKIDAAGLATWRGALLDAFDLAKKPEAPRTAGAHCDYCPARAICPQAHALVQLATSYSDTATAPLTPEQYLERFDICKHAEGTIKSFMEYVRALLDVDPDSVPGLVIGKGSETTTVTDPAGVYGYLEPTIGHANIMKCATFRVNAIASVMTGGSPTTKKLSKDGEEKKKWLKNELAGMITVATKQGSLKRV